MRTTRCALILLSLVALGGCKEAEKAADYAATRELADPATAEFRNVRTNTEGVTCGEVRGRDRSGAMTPFRKYMYFAHTGHAILQPVPDARDTARAANDNGPEMRASVALDAFETRYVIDCR